MGGKAILFGAKIGDKPTWGQSEASGLETEDRRSKQSGPNISRSLTWIGLMIVIFSTTNIGLADCQATHLSGDEFAASRARLQPAGSEPMMSGYTYGSAGGQAATGESGPLLMFPWVQKRTGSLETDRAMSHAIELGCRNLADSILAARSSADLYALAMSPLQSQQLGNLRDSKALDLLDLVEQERAKKANPKHTPRFG